MHASEFDKIVEKINNDIDRRQDLLNVVEAIAKHASIFDYVDEAHAYSCLTFELSNKEYATNLVEDIKSVLKQELDIDIKPVQYLDSALIEEDDGSYMKDAWCLYSENDKLDVSFWIRSSKKVKNASQDIVSQKDATLLQTALFDKFLTLVSKYDIPEKSAKKLFLDIYKDLGFKSNNAK